MPAIKKLNMYKRGIDKGYFISTLFFSTLSVMKPPVIHLWASVNCVHNDSQFVDIVDKSECRDKKSRTKNYFTVRDRIC